MSEQRIRLVYMIVGDGETLIASIFESENGERLIVLESDLSLLPIKLFALYNEKAELVIAHDDYIRSVFDLLKAFQHREKANNEQRELIAQWKAEGKL